MTSVNSIFLQAKLTHVVGVRKYMKHETVQWYTLTSFGFLVFYLCDLSDQLLVKSACRNILLPATFCVYHSALLELTGAIDKRVYLLR